MRRADRLFDIVEYMRRHRRVVTAEELGRKMEVSVRTIYRDIADLQASRVPIEGEAGLGYLLRPGYDLPPLMFSEDEAEALALGARIVASWADEELAESARAVLAKLRDVLPPPLQKQMDTFGVIAPPDHYRAEVSVDLAAIRKAVRARSKIRFSYVNAKGEPSERTVWPLTLAFYGHVWVIPAWCEEREAFRVFRADRMSDLTLPGERFPKVPGRDLDAYLQEQGIKPGDVLG